MAKIVKFKEFLKKKKKTIFHDFYTGTHKKDKWIPDDEPVKDKEIKEQFGPAVKPSVEFGKRKSIQSGVFEQGRAEFDKHKSDDKFASEMHGKESSKHLVKHYNSLEMHPSVNHVKNYTYTSCSEGVNQFLWKGEHDGQVSDETIHNTIKGTDHVLSSFKTPKDMFVYHGLNRSPEKYKENAHDSIGLKFKAYTSTSVIPRIASLFSTGDAQSKHNYWFKRKPGIHEPMEKKERVPLSPELSRLHIKRLKEGFDGEDHQNYNELMNQHTEQHGEGSPETFKHIIQIHVPEGSRGAYIGHISHHTSEHEFILPRNSRVKVHPRPTLHVPSGRVIWHAKLVHDGTENTRHWED